MVKAEKRSRQTRIFTSIRLPESHAKILDHLRMYCKIECVKYRNYGTENIT